MSLYKKLWIAIALLMLTVFAVTFAINGISSSDYLEEQLTLKNSDDAHALALSLSQQALVPESLEIQLSTKLDLGDYEWVELRGADGSMLFRRVNTPPVDHAPTWFRALFSIDSVPGSAKVSSDWHQLGTLSLKSFEDFAYDELWGSAQRTAIAFIVAMVVAGVALTLLLRVILAPLQQVVDQAQAIGERRFVMIPEPRTIEFAKVASSMNRLSGRVREMLDREAQRLERQRAASEIDRISGLALRRPLLARLRTLVDSESSDASGSLCIIRINDMVRLNQTVGRKFVDTLLRDIGAEIRHFIAVSDGWLAGRLNGSDFCLLAPHDRDSQQLGQKLQKVVSEVLIRHDVIDETALPTACFDYACGDGVSEIMTALDGALSAADQQAGSPVTVASRRSASVLPVREQTVYWKRVLGGALAEKQVFLELFPVLNAGGGLLHFEGMLRLSAQGETITAGEFMPWVYRLDLSGDVDRAVIQCSLETIKLQKTQLHVHLSANSLTDLSFNLWLGDLFAQNEKEAALLSLEVSESVAFTHPAGFQRLVKQAHPHNVQVGIEHMGYRVGDIGVLSELGADFMKLDATFVRDIDQNPGNQALVRTYVSIAQALGIPCFAEGVSTALELQQTIAIGCTGVTGPGVKVLDKD